MSDYGPRGSETFPPYSLPRSQLRDQQEGDVRTAFEFALGSAEWNDTFVRRGRLVL